MIQLSCPTATANLVQDDLHRLGTAWETGNSEPIGSGQAKGLSHQTLAGLKSRPPNRYGWKVWATRML